MLFCSILSTPTPGWIVCNNQSLIPIIPSNKSLIICNDILQMNPWHHLETLNDLFACIIYFPLKSVCNSVARWLISDSSSLPDEWPRWCSFNKRPVCRPWEKSQSYRCNLQTLAPWTRGAIKYADDKNDTITRALLMPNCSWWRFISCLMCLGELLSFNKSLSGRARLSVVRLSRQQKRNRMVNQFISLL